MSQDNKENKRHKSHKKDSDIISVKKAVKRVKRWLKFLDNYPLFKKHPHRKPRAMFIPVEDLKSLLAKYENYKGQSLEGFMIYYGLEKDKLDNDVFFQLKGMIVPRMKTMHSYTTPALKDNDSDIWDVTVTCPPYCSTNDVLHVKN